MTNLASQATNTINSITSKFPEPIADVMNAKIDHLTEVFVKTQVMLDEVGQAKDYNKRVAILKKNQDLLIKLVINLPGQAIKFFTLPLLGPIAKIYNAKTIEAGQRILGLVNAARKGEAIDLNELEEILMQLSGVQDAKDTFEETQDMLSELWQAKDNNERVAILITYQDLLIKFGKYMLTFGYIDGGKNVTK